MMRKSIWVFGLIMLACVSSSLLLNGCGSGGEKDETTVSHIPDPTVEPVLEQVWTDEFTENSPPNGGKWTYDIGYGPGDSGWGNDEWQLYTNNEENVHVGFCEDGEDNSCLIISANCPTGSCNKRDGSITSGRIKTQNKFSFKYGKVQARIKPPTGTGIWSAFWMLGVNFETAGWPKSGEIDVMEVHTQVSNANTNQFAMHWWDEQAVPPAADMFYQSKTFANPLSDDFHVFEVDWNENRVIGRIDGLKYFMKPIEPGAMSEFLQEFFLILNVAVGGTLGGAPDATTDWPQQMLVDWVRVYQEPLPPEESCDAGQVNFGAEELPENAANVKVMVSDLCAKQSSAVLTVDNGVDSIPVDFWVAPNGFGTATVNFGDTSDATDTISVTEGTTLTVYYTDSQENEQFDTLAITGPAASGCTDTDASNFDPQAFLDDGSCIYDVNFTVDMNCSGVTVENAVYITGPFCNWCDAGYPLADSDGDGVWTGTYAFAPGPLEFKYMIDNFSGQEDLVDDMLAGGTCAPITDYSSYANRQVEIVDAPLSLDQTYGDCDECLVENISGCTDPDAANYNALAVTDDGSCNYNVNFAVDMSCSGVAVNDAVYITGPFCNWCDAGYPLADSDGDGVWTGAYPFAPGILEYKYMVDGFADQENLVDDMLAGGTCAPVTDYANYANRQVEIVDAPVTRAETYGSCDTCAPGVQNVTFSVDMNCSGETVTDAVFVTGPFCDWCDAGYPLTVMVSGPEPIPLRLEIWNTNT
jgi:hypothetical protein